MLLEHTFLSWVPESSADVPSYQEWLDRQDLTDAYRYLARFLRFIQWQKKEAGRGGGRWILKSPFHLAYIDPLFEVFPGARVVQTHRDPLETIPSAASMYRSLQALNTDRVDPQRVGDAVRLRYRGALERCMRSRARHEPERFIDVDYRAVGRDAIGEARRIYAWLGLELTDEAERAMLAWNRDNARERRAPHAYSLEEFGFTREGLASDFSEYRSQHVFD